MSKRLPLAAGGRHGRVPSREPPGGRSGKVTLYLSILECFSHPCCCCCGYVNISLCKVILRNAKRFVQEKTHLLTSCDGCFVAEAEQTHFKGREAKGALGGPCVQGAVLSVVSSPSCACFPILSMPLCQGLVGSLSWASQMTNARILLLSCILSA